MSISIAICCVKIRDYFKVASFMESEQMGAKGCNKENV